MNCAKSDCSTQQDSIVLPSSSPRHFTSASASSTPATPRSHQPVDEREATSQQAESQQAESQQSNTRASPEAKKRSSARTMPVFAKKVVEELSATRSQVTASMELAKNATARLESLLAVLVAQMSGTPTPLAAAARAQAGQEAVSAQVIMLSQPTSSSVAVASEPRTVVQTTSTSTTTTTKTTTLTPASSPQKALLGRACTIVPAQTESSVQS
jgi:hypothetical protein